MKKDIENFEDIQQMVNSFYDKIRKDAVLGKIFDDRIQDKWTEHLEKMYRFWQTILTSEITYTGQPFTPHTSMPIDKTHFDQWKAIFVENIDSQFEGKVAEEAKTRAISIANVFQFKIESL